MHGLIFPHSVSSATRTSLQSVLHSEHLSHVICGEPRDTGMAPVSQTKRSPRRPCSSASPFLEGSRSSRRRRGHAGRPSVFSSHVFSLLFGLSSFVPCTRYLWERLSEVGGLDLLGPPPNASGDNRNPLLAFNSRDVHAHDLSFFMDQASHDGP